MKLSLPARYPTAPAQPQHSPSTTCAIIVPRFVRHGCWGCAIIVPRFVRHGCRGCARSVPRFVRHGCKNCAMICCGKYVLNVWRVVCARSVPMFVAIDSHSCIKKCDSVPNSYFRNFFSHRFFTVSEFFFHHQFQHTLNTVPPPVPAHPQYIFPILVFLVPNFFSHRNCTKGSL